MDALKDSVAEMGQMFLTKLGEFEERQKMLISPTTTTASSLDAEFASFKAFTLSALRALQKQVELLARETDNLEMHTRRKILLLHGIPEGKQDDTTAIVANTVVERLKVIGFQSGDITRCHRMGRVSAAGRPRPILFKVRDTSHRSKIWAAKTNLKGSGITVSEFLTKPRHDAFMEARQRFGVTKCWTRDGFVYVLDEGGQRHRVGSTVELQAIPKQSVVAAATSKAPVKEPMATKSRRAATSSKK